MANGFNNDDFNADGSITAGTSVDGGQLNIDNITIDGNTISSTDTNGDINLIPDGSGSVIADSVEMNSGTIYANGGTADVLTTERSNSGVHWSLVRNSTEVGTVEADASGPYFQGVSGVTPLRVLPFGLGSALTVSTDGIITTQYQPAFLAYSSSTQSNATGTSGTGFVKVAFGTEARDQGGIYNNSTYTMTVPTDGTGFYWLHASLFLDDVVSATQIIGRFVTSVETSEMFQLGNVADTNGNIVFDFGLLTYLTAGDTAYVVCRVIGEASDTVDIRGSGRLTRFSAHKLG